MNIDWSKAPEGTTHYAPSGPGVSARWFDMDNGRVFHKDKWEEIHYWAGREDLIPRPEPEAWTGAGFPPAGADVEYNIGDGWYECLVKYVLNRPGEQSYALVAWCYHLDKDQYLSLDKGCKFRPIRTPEQIAAEEREKEIEILANIIYSRVGLSRDDTFKIASAIYEAGYQKKIAP